MNGTGRDFFVSYTAKNESWAEWIGHVLEESGYSVFLQAWDFRPGNNFVREMQRSLESAERVIAVLSPDYLEAPFPLSEWASAFASDPEGLERRLIPVMVESCKPEGVLGQIVHIRIYDLDDEAAKQALLEGVRSERAKPDEPPSFPGSGGGTASDPQSEPVATSETDARKKQLKASYIGLAAFVIVASLCGLIQAIPDPTPSLPEENGTRPIGSNDAAIIQATVSALSRCAKAVALKPVNCPQEVEGRNSNAEDIKWQIRGNPGEGAIVRYNGTESLFHVLGTAVMTASYRTSFGSELSLQVVHYWARVEWSGGKAKLAAIQKYDDSPRPPTPKSNPGIPGNELLYVVGTGFEQCAAAKTSPLPPNCLQGVSSNATDKASWKINGDPTINASANFDESTGLIHIVGNYSMNLSYKVFLLGPTSAPYNGQYDAIVSVDSDKPRLLMIVSND